VVSAGLIQAFAVGLVLHRLHSDPASAHEVTYVPPVLHWLRDSALAAPLAVLLLFIATSVARRLSTTGARPGDGVAAHALWAGLGAAAYAAASVPAALVHARLFGAHHEQTSFLLHSAKESLVTLRYSFALLVAFALAAGLPWARRRSLGTSRRLTAEVATPTAPGEPTC
jgi:hypothetical protein